MVVAAAACQFLEDAIVNLLSSQDRNTLFTPTESPEARCLAAVAYV
jgi:hypothetical protein